MAVNSIIGDLTNEIIQYIYLQTKKKNTRKKIKYMINTVTSLIFDDVKPYLYTILAILIIMFLMNCFSFYYYIRLFAQSNPHYDMNLLANL